jgi:uncharacterized delta-60 repeat protein
MKQLLTSCQPLKYSRGWQKGNYAYTCLMAVLFTTVFLIHGQKVYAQCNAGSFIPPNYLTTSEGGIVWSFVQEPDGKFTIAGNFTNGTNVNHIARLNSDGSIDNTFTSPTLGGYSDNNRLRTVVKLSDGKYMVGGFFTTPHKGIVRLNSDGSLDNTFVPPSTITHPNGSYINKIVPLSNGQYLVSGVFSQPKESIMRLNSDGSLDDSFGYVGVPGPTTPNRILNGVQDFEILADGKIIVTSANGVERLNADGTRDLTFTNIIFGSSSSIIQAVEILPDGKILASGSFSSVANRVMRLNSDGTLDNTFTAEPGLTGTVFELKLQPDGTIMIGGTFSGAIMRLNADGSRDNTLDIPTVDGGSVRVIEQLPSGFFMASGNFNIPRAGIAILCTSAALELSGVSGNYCEGQTASVSYNSGSTYNAGNVFTVQLSNASGSFTSPTTIGTLTSTSNSGSISITIPANTPAGSGYRMRVLSSGDAFTSADNGSDIAIGVQQTPTLTAGSPSAACDGTVTISSSGSYSSYAWSTGATTSSATVSANSSYTLTVTDANGCTASVSTTVSSIVPCCTAPSQPGVIAGVQSICPGTAAAMLSSTTAASSGVGTLEYRWQRSTISGSAGFTDIPGSNSATYSPGVLNTTTWFRRLGGVSCLTDWSAAPASNVVQVSVQDVTPPSISCMPYTLVFNGQANVNLNVNELAAASDNCGLQSVVASTTSISCSQLGQAVPVTITATDNSGNMASCISTVTVQGLPCNWRQQPDGVNCTNGNNVSFNTGNQSFTLTSTNCQTPMAPHTSDGFAFAQRTLCGDGSLQALVVSVDGSGWGGIAMRESNAAGAKKVHLLTNRQTQHRREVRTTDNGQVIPQMALSAQRYWLRLVRTGSDILGLASANGTQWVQVMAAKVNMNSCIEIGLITHHNNVTGNVTTVFSDVAVTGNAGSGALQQAGNSEQTAEEVVTNQGRVFPNPTTAEVLIDLSDFRTTEMQVAIFDQLGRQLQLLQVSPADVPWQRVDLSAYPAGVYIVKMSAEGQPVQTERIILQRP